jgi:hypothetical protein
MRQRKHEVAWEAIKIAAHRLVQRARGHAIERGKVPIKHDLLAANDMNMVFDGLGLNGWPG